MSETMADFEKEIDASFRQINNGDVIEGVVTAVADDAAYLDINYHKQGIVKKADFSDDPEFNMQSVKVGDTLKAVIVSTSDKEGNVVLSVKNAAKAEAWEKVQQYLEDGTVLDIKISGIVNKGVIAYVEGLRGFIPASHLEIGYVEDTEPYMGKEAQAKVITADPAKNRLVLSIKEVLFQKRREERENKINAIEVGSIMEGTVESLKNYGAFIDLGDGVSGLVLISQIAMKRIESPAEVLKEGDTVKVKVLKVEDGKISLSIKQADENYVPRKRGGDKDQGSRPARRSGGRRGDKEPTSYKDEGEATTSLADLLKGIEL